MKNNISTTMATEWSEKNSSKATAMITNLTINSVQGVSPEISELLQIPGNDTCVDCRSPNPGYLSCKLGMLMCQTCAQIHQCLGPEFSKIKTLQDKWTKDDVQKLRSFGNIKSQALFERRVPVYYKKPTNKDPPTLLEQWIRAKYERQEFVEGSSPPSYETGRKEGELWKRGKNSKHFKKRRFVLGSSSDQLCTLKYFNKETAREPKAEMKVDDINVLLSPEKIGHPNGLQILFTQDDYPRSLYLYAETGQEAVDWFLALRAAKLQKLAIAFPGSAPAELCGMLCVENIKEGWLWKAGPKTNDAYRKRWLVLTQKRKLLYYEDPLSAFPKGEVYLGTTDRYSVDVDKLAEFGVALRTPERVYHFKGEELTEQAEWITALCTAINLPPAPHDRATPLQTKRVNIRDSMMSLIKR